MDIIAEVLKLALETEAADVMAPEALIVCVPDAEDGTVKAASHAPLSFALILEVTVFPSKVMLIPVSLAAKPAPETVIELPGAALELLRDMPAPVINVALDTEPVMELEVAMACDPADEEGTVNVIVQDPIELAVVLEPTALLSKVILILVSPALKPAPVTVIELPGGPLVLLREIIAVVLKLVSEIDPAVVDAP